MSNIPKLNGSIVGKHYAVSDRATQRWGDSCVGATILVVAISTNNRNQLVVKWLSAPNKAPSSNLSDWRTLINDFEFDMFDPINLDDLNYETKVESKYRY